MAFLPLVEKFFLFGIFYYKIMCKIEINDKKILKEFLNCRIPKGYNALDCKKDSGYPDLMYNYEEVFDYSDALLKGKKICLKSNFIDVESVAVNDDFKAFLIKLGNDDKTMEEFCNKFIKAITVIQNYST